MRNTKKQRLMIEQNRSLFMIAVVSIAIIGIVSVAMLFSTGKSDDNKDSLREAIEKVLFDEDLALIFARNGQKLIKEKYNWDIINNQILEIYKRFL